MNERLSELNTMLLSDALKFWHMGRTSFYEKLGKCEIDPKKVFRENGKRTVAISEVIRVKELELEKSKF